jgi:hypothetical protein
VNSRLGRLQRIALVSALVWAVGLIIAAVLLPAYQSSTGSATLVAVNGWGVLLAAGAPLIAALVISSLLWRRRGRPGAGAITWVVVALLGCFNLLAMLTIGVFVLPVTLALVVACSTHGSKPAGAFASSSVSA